MFENIYFVQNNFNQTFSFEKTVCFLHRIPNNLWRKIRILCLIDNGRVCEGCTNRIATSLGIVIHLACITSWAPVRWVFLERSHSTTRSTRVPVYRRGLTSKKKKKIHGTCILRGQIYLRFAYRLLGNRRVTRIWIEKKKSKILEPRVAACRLLHYVPPANRGCT